MLFSRRVWQTLGMLHTMGVLQGGVQLAGDADDIQPLF